MSYVAFAFVLSGIILEIIGIVAKSKEFLAASLTLLALGVSLAIVSILRSLI